MSWSLIALPDSFRAHASGVWSTVRSKGLEHSEQKGWSFRARMLSFSHV